MSKLFQYIQTESFRKNLIISIISFALFIFLIFFLLRVYTHHDEQISVPKLTGMSMREAVKTLENKAFGYLVDSVYQEGAEPGMVIDQDPIAGSKVKANRTIYLTIITMVPPEVKFPEVKELTFLEAKAIIQNYGLNVGDTIYIPDIARDRVLDVKYGGEKLKTGQQIPKGSKISLILGNGRGDSEVEIPNVVGLTLSEATFSIKGSSLTLGTVRYMGYVTDTLNARVVSQTPMPDSLQNEKVSIGTPINLALSN